MERFVFVAAIALAIIFGIGAVVGGPHFSFHGDWDDEDGIGGTAEIVAVSPGRMEAQTFAGTTLRLRHMAAIVTITPEDRTDFAVEIDNSAGTPADADRRRGRRPGSDRRPAARPGPGLR